MRETVGLTYFLLLLGASVAIVSGQLVGFGCPLQWESFQDSCYEFVFHPQRVYREAAQACWTQGSALVSINSLAEHRFVTDYLNRYAVHKESQWYTSGVAMGSRVKWNGDGTYSNNTLSDQYWNPGAFDLSYSFIVYQFTEKLRRYGWMKSSAYSELNYICEIPRSEVSRLVIATRDYAFGTNHTDPAHVKMGPKFIVEPTSTVVVEQSYSNSVSLECVATGNRQPSFHWYQQVSNAGVTSYQEVTVDMDPRYTITNGRLTIDMPTDKQDAGEYQCKAENEMGSILSNPVLVSFGYLNEFSPNQQGFVEAYVYQGTFINCNAPSAKPGLTYVWYRNSTQDFIRPELMNYFFISSNGNLYFSEVQYYDAGQYFCITTLVASSGATLSTSQPPSRTSQGIELRVRGAPSTKYGPIIHNDFIAVFPKPAMAGHEVRMECLAYGRSLRYRWTREGRDFPEGTTFTDNNRILTIPKAKFEDAGHYTCHVMTTAFDASASRSTYLNIEAKPFFTFPLRNMHADEGMALTWRCEAQAKPAAVYSWYKNSQLLQHVPGDIEIRENVLYIHSLHRDRHPGMYQCGATNSFGTSFTSAELRILSFKPDFSRVPLPAVTVGGQGGNLTISCSPEAAPVPEVTWYHNGGQIGMSADGRHQMNIDGSLTISQLTYPDQGRYTCKAANENGEGSSSTMLRVVAGIQFVYSPVDTMGDINRTSFMLCEASYDYTQYDLVYVWKFNGRLIDFHRHPFYRQDSRAGTHGLYIVNAQYYHTGVYECIAQTVFNSISASANLLIRGPPGEPAGVYVVDGSIVGSSVRLMWTWSAHNNHGYPVTYFAIEAKSELNTTWTVIEEDVPEADTVVDETSEKRFYNLHDLYPYNSYSFRVRAKNFLGVGLASIPSPIYKIPAAAPALAPFSVGGGQGSVGVLTITWKPLHQSLEGAPGFGYTVYWRRTNETIFWREVKAGNVSSYTVTVGADNYYLQYDVKVSTYNDIGPGPESDFATIYSAEGIPLAVPTNIQGSEINGTALLITWDQVPNTRESVKGQVMGYEIDYTDVENPLGVSNSINIYCVCGEGIVVGLDPNSNYWVNVEVFNSAGTGTPSERSFIGTFEDPPSHFPQFVEVHPHGEHSARVVWRGVSTILGEASLSGYKIIYWPVTDDIRTANFTVVEKVTEAVIYGLQFDTIYKLRAMAINRGGDGKKGPEIFFSFAKDGSVNTGSFDPATTQLLFASRAPTLSQFSLFALLLLYYITSVFIK